MVPRLDPWLKGDFGKRCFWDVARAHRGGIAPNLCQTDGDRAMILMV